MKTHNCYRRFIACKYRDVPRDRSAIPALFSCAGQQTGRISDLPPPSELTGATISSDHCPHFH